MFIYILGLFFPLIAVLFESYPRFINRKVGVDIWTHLLYLKEYHKQKGIPKKIENGFLVSGRYDYPPVFIFILSKFPFHLVENYEFLFSPFFDAIHLIIIYFFVFMITGNIFIALTTQILYILTPIIVIENSSATPRSLGYTLLTIVLLLLFAYIQFSIIWCLIFACILGSFIFLSHRFTTQGFLFFAIFFTLYDNNITYLVAFLISGIIAIIISRGFYLTVLQGHMGNLKFWYNNIQYRFAHQVKGNFKEYKTKDFIFVIYNQCLKFPPFVLSITNPWTLPVFFIVLNKYPQNFLYQHLLWWSLFAYLLSLFTIWIPQLRFLGEGQRYLELSVFPTVFLSANLLFDSITTKDSFMIMFIYGILAFGAFIAIIIIQSKAIIKEKLRTITPDMLKIFNYLKSLEKKPNLLCIPHQITTNTIYHTDCPVFVNADYTNIEKISEVYPYFRLPIAEIMKKYKLDMIFLNEDYAKIEDLKLKNYKLIKRVNEFCLIILK